MYNTISELEFYKKLTPSEKEEISVNSKIVKYKNNDLIYSASKKCFGMLIVKSGVLRTYLLSKEGKKATIYRLREGDICVLSIPCLIPNIKFDIEIECEQNCEGIVIPANVLLSIKESNVYFKNYVYENLMEKFALVINAIQQLAFMSLREKIFTFLIEEMEATNNKIIKITQEKLAENIGSAREAVNREINKLKQEGIIEVSRGKIEIINIEKLRLN